MTMPSEKARSPVFRLSLKAIVLLTFLSTLSSAAWAFDFDTTKTNVIRDRTNPKKLTLTVTLKGVNATDRQNFGITKSEAPIVQQAFVNTLDICLSQNSSTCGETDVHVRWSTPRLPNGQVENAYLSTTQLANFDSNGTILTQDTTDPNLWQYQVRILITDNSDIAVGTKVLLRFFPEKVSTNANKDLNDLTAKLGSGVKDSVSVTGVFGTPKSLTVLFDKKSTVTFMDDTSAAPNGVKGIIIPQPSAATAVPTLVYEATPSATPTQASCSINVSANSETCSLNCSNTNPQTLDFTAAESQGFATSSSETDSNTIGFANVSLANGPYAIVLQYLPEGTGLGCYMGTPTEAGTLVQISGGKEPEVGDPNCFIATAAYGSALDPHIDALRWFRDSYLLKTAWGKAFVKAYYRNSPPIADWISQNDTARLLTRAALWAPVLFIEALRDHFFATLAGMIALAFVISIFKRRSSHTY